MAKEILELYKTDCQTELRKDENAQIPTFSEWREINKELIESLINEN